MLSEDKIKVLYTGVCEDINNFKKEDINLLDTQKLLEAGILSGLKTILEAILEIKDGE